VRISIIRSITTLFIAGVLFSASTASSLAAEDEEEEGKTKCPDKSQYTLFNPTPANCLREFDPDRPDVTDSPFTVDAGHIQFESSLFSYALSRPDRQGVVSEEFDILDTNIRLGISNYAEIDLDIPPLDIEHTRFPISRFDRWKSGTRPAGASGQSQFFWERQF
jgi:hypothetical protein